jgi:D-serine deaminase-like pyridoxal phosphate-dependent protein
MLRCALPRAVIARTLARMPYLFSDIETPVPLVDLDRLAVNLDRMAAYAALHQLALRPHVKTHKSARIAAEQMRLGAVGLTVATPRELQVMSEVTDNVFLAHPPMGAKIRRVLTFSEDVQLRISVDSFAAIEALGTACRQRDHTVDVLVEVDLGMKRMGVADPNDVVRLAGAIRRQPGLRYRGICFYPGHIRQNVAQQEGLIDVLSGDLAEVLQTLEHAGLAAEVVSGGSTPAAFRMHHIPGLTEIRPGTYVFNDRDTFTMGACAWEDCALTVLATVISDAVPGQVVIDAGVKALGREPIRVAEGGGYGALLDHPEVSVARMSEEHGILDLSDSLWRPEVGEQVRIVPNHACIVTHLFDAMLGVRGDIVETWWHVGARGRHSPELAPPPLSI